MLPVFGTLLIANSATFAFGFMPLLGRLPLWVLEPVVASTLVMKLVVASPVFQRGLPGRELAADPRGSRSWGTPVLLLGVLASQTPWLEHNTGGMGEFMSLARASRIVKPSERRGTSQAQMPTSA